MRGTNIGIKESGCAKVTSGGTKVTSGRTKQFHTSTSVKNLSQYHTQQNTNTVKYLGVKLSFSDPLFRKGKDPDPMSCF